MSGCTAAVSVISKHKIWVVRILFSVFHPRRGLSLISHRPTLVTPGRFSVSRVAQSPCPSITSRRMWVGFFFFFLFLFLREAISVSCMGVRSNIVTTGEKARISAAGGFVDFGRVNGNLALSRAIGDFEFKKSAELSPEQQIVTAYPDVTVHELTDDDEFLVIACDGLCFKMET